MDKGTKHPLAPHQQLLEEEERKLELEEKKLREEERKLELEKIKRRQEEKKEKNTNNTSGTLKQQQIDASKSPSSPKPNVTLTEREREMLLYIAELKNTIEKLTKHNTELAQKLQMETEMCNHLKEMIRQQAEEIKVLKLDVAPSPPSKEEKKERKKSVKLFSSRSTSKENLAEDTTASKRRSGSIPESPSSSVRQEAQTTLDSTVRPRDPSSSPAAATSPTDDDKKLTLESITKADMIKEMLGNKYQSFALLRKNQIEQLETRRATYVRTRGNTAETAAMTNALKAEQDKRVYKHTCMSLIVP